MRVGTGYDVHKLKKTRPLIIGGVTIPFEEGLDGHSDADVLTHAIIDALLGAAALGDIGKHFPDSDTSLSGASSMAMLRQVGGMIRAEGYDVANIDATVIAQRPHMSPHTDDMRLNIGAALDIDPGQISVKSTTEEGLGFTGAGLGIAAQAVCLLIAAPIKSFPKLVPQSPF